MFYPRQSSDPYLEGILVRMDLTYQEVQQLAPVLEWSPFFSCKAICWPSHKRYVAFTLTYAD